MFLSDREWFNAVKGDDIFTIVGDHADERETSLILHLHPDLVLPKNEWGPGTDNRWKLKAINEKWAWAQRALVQGDERHRQRRSTAQHRRQRQTLLRSPRCQNRHLPHRTRQAADISDLYEKSK
jgi:hypothetical protein